MLGREGGGAVTHRAVAAEAGVPLAATTYYFASKDELVRAAYALALERDVAQLRATPPPEPRGGARAAAGWLVGLYLPVTPADRVRQLVLSELELQAARRPELASLSHAWSAAYATAVSAVLASLGCEEPAADAWIVVAALEGMTLDVLAAERDGRADHVRTVERLLGALAAPRPSR